MYVKQKHSTSLAKPSQADVYEYLTMHTMSPLPTKFLMKVFEEEKIVLQQRTNVIYSFGVPVS
jgi:hypothetical protein